MYIMLTIPRINALIFSLSPLLSACCRAPSRTKSFPLPFILGAFLRRAWTPFSNIWLAFCPPRIPLGRMSIDVIFTTPASSILDSSPRCCS